METFPQTRLRRTRQSDWSRRMVREQRLTVHDLIWPVFVSEDDEAGPIKALPGVHRYGIAELVMHARRAWQLGIPALAIFPATPADLKTAEGKEALNPDNLICRAIKAVKDAVPDIGLIGDVALDPYTSHGHDGVLRQGRIVNDETLAILADQSLILAQAGCDMIAPSDMMDGRIAAIRRVLEESGFHNTMIISYAAKYASAFYGPFREAVGSAGALAGGDKSTYQMDPANGDEAMREIALDITEGADMVMIKPGMPYLDVLRRAYERFDVPILAYQVSGEYAMLKHAARQGAFDAERAMLESLLAFKRAGSRAILTYAALEVAESLQD